MSLREGSVIDTSPVLQTVADSLGTTVSEIDHLPSGNSQVFRLRCLDGRCVLAKSYPDPAIDGRDRLKTEFGALSFLWDNDVCDVPEPVGCNADHRVGLYSFVDGTSVDPVRDEDVDRAAAFLCELSALRDVARNSGLSPASEACFDGPAYVSSVAGRFERFTAVEPSTSYHQEALRLVQDELTPLFEQVRPLMEGCSVAQDERALSPSDFGFHNSIRRRDGKIVFVDFEYFGWDDPAKMISDFLLHPGHALPASGRSRFLQGLWPVFGDDRLQARLRCVYPLLALKWCFILMNEFLPGSAGRRRRAAGTESDDTWQSEVLPQQLIKVRRMIERTKEALKPDFQMSEVVT